MKKTFYVWGLAAFLALYSCNSKPAIHTETTTTTPSATIAQPSTNAAFDAWKGNYEYIMDGGQTAGGTGIVIGYYIDAKTSEMVSFQGSGFQTDFTISCKAKVENSKLILLATKAEGMFAEDINQKIAAKQEVVVATISQENGQYFLASEQAYDGDKPCVKCALTKK